MLIDEEYYPGPKRAILEPGATYVILSSNFREAEEWYNRHKRETQGSRVLYLTKSSSPWIESESDEEVMYLVLLFGWASNPEARDLFRIASERCELVAYKGDRWLCEPAYVD